jgi:hypothetical protein
MRDSTQAPLSGLAEFKEMVDQTGRYLNLLDQIERLLKKGGEGA